MNKQRLIELQALRDHVRNSLAPLSAGTLKRAANFFRLDCLLDEGDELQREVERLQAERAGPRPQHTAERLKAFGYEDE